MAPVFVVVLKLSYVCLIAVLEIALGFYSLGYGASFEFLLDPVFTFDETLEIGREVSRVLASFAIYNRLF